MADTLTLATPETFPSITTWRVSALFIDVDAPAIKVDLVANTGARFTWRYIPSDTVTASQVLNAIGFINQGNFKVLQAKTLNKWILDQIVAAGAKVGVTD